MATEPNSIVSAQGRSKKNQETPTTAALDTIIIPPIMAGPPKTKPSVETTPTSASSRLPRLQIELEDVYCAICLEIYQDPTCIGECHHTFCRDCLHLLLKGADNQNLPQKESETNTTGITVNCPTCQKEYILSREDVRQLPVNNEIKKTLQILREDGVIPQEIPKPLPSQFQTYNTEDITDPFVQMQIEMQGMAASDQDLPLLNIQGNDLEDEFARSLYNSTMHRRVNAPLLTITRYKPRFIISATVLCAILMLVEFIVYRGVVPLSVNPWIGVDLQTLVTLGGKYSLLEQQGQIWRLLTATFLHAGLVHFALNMIVQLSLGIQVERFIGPVRMAILFIVSGAGGNLLSTLFIRQAVTVGTSGAIFGICAVYIVDVLVHWRYYPHPVKFLITISLSVLSSLVVGLLPWVDNFAHIGGLLSGIFICMIIHPKSDFEYEKSNKWRIAIGCLLLAGWFVIGLVLLFEHIDVQTRCHWCEYCNCLPLWDWCKGFL